MENTEGQKANARGENNDKIKRTVVYGTAVVPAWGGSNGQYNKQKKREQKNDT